MLIILNLLGLRCCVCLNLLLPGGGWMSQDDAAWTRGSLLPGIPREQPVSMPRWEQPAVKRCRPRRGASRRRVTLVLVSNSKKTPSAPLMMRCAFKLWRGVILLRAPTTGLEMVQEPKHRPLLFLGTLPRLQHPRSLHGLAWL